MDDFIPKCLGVDFFFCFRIGGINRICLPIRGAFRNGMHEIIVDTNRYVGPGYFPFGHFSIHEGFRIGMFDAYGEHECATPSVLGYFPGRVRIALHERYEAGRCKGGVFNRCAFRAYMAEVMPHAAASFHKLHLLFVDADNPSIRIGVPVQADYKAV